MSDSWRGSSAIRTVVLGMLLALPFHGCSRGDSLGAALQAGSPWGGGSSAETSVVLDASNPSQVIAGETIAFKASAGRQTTLVWSSSDQRIDPATGTWSPTASGTVTISVQPQGHPEAAVSFTVTVQPAAAASLAVLSGSGQSTTIGTAFSQPLWVKAMDSFGNPVSGLPVVFAPPSSGAGGVFSGSASVLTGQDGTALAPALTANNEPGAFSVTATSGPLSASFSLTNLDHIPAFSYGASAYSFTLGSAGSTITPVNTGGSATWSISPALPSGLSFRQSDGSIDGTPLQISEGQDYTITAVNSGGQSSATLRINVAAFGQFSAQVSSAVHPAGTVVTGRTLTFAYSVANTSQGSNLLNGPEGLTQSVATGSGSIQVTAPATAGSYDYTLVAQDGLGHSESRTCTVEVVDPTTISGVVYLPNGADPVPYALVYMPVGSVSALETRVSQMNATHYLPTVPTQAYAYAIADAQGHFTLGQAATQGDLPENATGTLVLQLGKWRRQLSLTGLAARQDNPQSATTCLLPKNQTEGDIPRMAVLTGSGSAPESIPWKMGIDTAEFTAPSGTGRIHFYAGSYAYGIRSVGGVTLPSETTLFTVDGQTQEENIYKYDLVIAACQGGMSLSATDWPAMAYASDLKNYLNAGGRCYAEHYTTAWFKMGGNYDAWITWNASEDDANSASCSIDTGTQGGTNLASWLLNSTASTTLGQVTLTDIRSLVASVNTPARSWVSWTSSGHNYPEVITFNTPIETSIDQQFGRVCIGDLHIHESSYPYTFPAECGSLTSWSSNERLFEFMFMDLLNPLSIQ